MYSAYKLNKQGDNIQPWCTLFFIWNQSVVPCPVLTVASWPAYRFLKRQVSNQIHLKCHYCVWLSSHKKKVLNCISTSVCGKPWLGRYFRDITRRLWWEVEEWEELKDDARVKLTHVTGRIPAQYIMWGKIYMGMRD